MNRRTLVVSLLLFLAPAAQADNCYVHERGSDSWLACKEQAGQMEQLRQESNAQMREIQAENAQASANDVLTERLQAMVQRRKNEYLHETH